MHRVEGYFGRELGTILAQGVKLPTLAHHSLLGSIYERINEHAVFRAETMRYEAVQRLPDQMIPGVKKQGVGYLVGHLNNASLINHYGGDRRRIYGRAESFFFSVQRIGAEP